MSPSSPAAIQVSELTKHFMNNTSISMRLSWLLAFLLCFTPAGWPRADPNSQPQGQPQRLGTTTVKLPSGKKLTVEVASTELEKSLGMMWRKVIPPGAGMLFVFDDEAQQSFWMKNTLVDLDMIFIDAEKRITAIEMNVPKSRPDTPDDQVAVRQAQAQFVLELPAGSAARFRLKTGQVLQFDPSRIRPQPAAKPGRGKTSGRKPVLRTAALVRSGALRRDSGVCTFCARRLRARTGYPIFVCRIMFSDWPPPFAEISSRLQTAYPKGE